MSLRVKIVTAGCKSNFADSSSIAREARSLGFEIVPDGAVADLVVVNGCTVTHRADRDSRSLARRARRENPGARVVVTGCYAEVRGSEATRLPDADLWVPPSADPSLSGVLRAEAARAGIVPPAGTTIPSVHESDRLLGHRRTFLKIQDGCDARCAYCAIPLARGSERSVPPPEVLALARRAEETGAREIVLTGIHVGRYGAGSADGGGLASLVETLLDGTRHVRYRLGSLEPLEVTRRLLSAVASSAGRVCPHFHVPLQSGSDDVLRRMGRPYVSGRYRETLSAIRAHVPGARVGADVIVGYPGETHGEFDATLALVEGGGIDYLHVFPYSAREGTAAYREADDVPPEEKRRRSSLLLSADRAARERDAAARIGTTEEMIVERHDPPTGTVRGTGASYHAIRTTGSPGEEGHLLRVRIDGREDGTLTGARLP